MKCTKCGSKNLVLVESGPHDKLVCGDCLTFQKFLSEADALTFRQMQEDPTRLSEVDELKTKILRLVEDLDESIGHEELSNVGFLTLSAILEGIRDLCK